MALSKEGSRLPGSGRVLAATMAGSATLGLTLMSLCVGVIGLVDDEDRLGLLVWDTFTLGDSYWSTVGLLQTGAQLVFLGTLAALFHRARRNLDLFGVDGMRFSAGWAAASFFVPILNLFRPYQVAKELWQASDAQEDGDWHATPVTGLLNAWWAPWIVMAVLGRLQRSLQRNEDWQAALFLGLVVDALFFAAVLSATLFARSLFARQASRHARSKEVAVGEAVAHVPLSGEPGAGG